MTIMRESAIRTADDYVIDPIDGRPKLSEVTQAVDVLKPTDTDMCNAERLVKYYGHRLRYCYERKRWLIWNGKVWVWDTGAKIAAVAKQTVRTIYHEAGDEPDLKARKQLAAHAKHSESDHRLNAMINLAKSEAGIPVSITELDNDPWLFNCQNGTIDLRTGELLPHRKDDLITVLVPVEYQPDAQRRRWLSFLDRVTGGDSGLMAYLQRSIGYSLTGNTRDQVVFLLYGLGNNGKSTFTMTIRKLVAGYAERLDTQDLMLNDRKLGGGPREGIANLRNKRYVVGSELQDGRRLDVSLVKDMTGGETVKGRRLYEHEFEFMPTHKLWLYGNHRPVITDTTLSIWRRVKLIPFNVTVADGEIDPDLASKLELELPGILAWAVNGCLDWQQYGLNDPQAVATATASYRHEQDILGDFLEDRCIIEPLARIPKADLKEQYQEWCQDNSVEPVTQRTFKARLVEKGIVEGRIGKTRYWRGIRLKTDADSDSLGDESDKTFNDSRSEVTKENQFPVKSPYEEEQKDFVAETVINVTNVTDGDIPDCPSEPCRCGCSDYWLTHWRKWVCSQCHPKPEQGGDGKTESNRDTS